VNRISLRLRMAIIAAVLSAIAIAIVGTFGLRIMEDRLTAARLDAAEAGAQEWLDAPSDLGPSANMAAAVTAFGVDPISLRLAMSNATAGSDMAALMDRLGVGPDDPIGVPIDNTLVAVFDGIDVTASSVDAPGPPLVDFELLSLLVSPRVGLTRTDDLDLVFGVFDVGTREVLYGADRSEARATVDNVRRWALLWSPLVVLGTFVLAWFLTRGALRPVGRMTAQVASMTPAAARDGERVPLPGTRDELGELAVQLNELVDRVVEGDLRQRRFTADAGHELRSPLAVLRSEAEQALTPGSTIGRDELAETVLVETLRLQGLVEELLVVARLDERADHVEGEPVDIDDVVLSEARRLRSSCLDLHAVGAGRVLGDAELLTRAIRHVLGNAIRHATSRVSVSVRAEDGWVNVQVDDDGSGVSETDRERVFERFVRLDEGRSRDAGGAGLGLAVVAEVIRSHGGHVAVLDSPSGGARFVLQLPEHRD
jgi:signal transduction histidine kinase